MVLKTEKNYSYLTLGLVMAIGLARRLYHLSVESIWIEEGYSIFFAKFEQILRIEDDMSPFYLNRHTVIASLAFYLLVALGIGN